MKPVSSTVFCAGLVLVVACPARADVSAAMRTGIPDAAYVAIYSSRSRALAARATLHLSVAAHLGPPVSLTPDKPYAKDGSALNIWKPSFVLGTADGGEAGLNFWGLHDDGHINVSLASGETRTRVLDCRILSPATIVYKIYDGGDKPAEEGLVMLADHHALLAVPVSEVDKPVLVELWPATHSDVVGFFGCDISTVK